MEQDNEQIELRFEGNGIKPSKVRASEVATLIASFERSILAIVREEHPELSEDFVFISFDEIKESSLALKCIAHKPQLYVAPAYSKLTVAFVNNNFNSLPNESIEDLRVIQRFAKKHACDGVFLKNGERLASFNSEVDISYNDEGIVKGETTIYGEVKKAGGETPRVQLKINDSYTISFEVKKDIAVHLASNLYKEVGLKGIARWDKKTFKILDFKAEGIIEVQENTLVDAFKELNTLFGDHLDKGISYIN